MFTLIIILFNILLLCIPSCYAQQKAAIYAQIFNTSTYDPTIRPNLSINQPVYMNVNYRINLLYSVSAVNEVYSIDLYVRESWYDNRLVYNESLWPVSTMGVLRIPTSKVWKPDTFFLNAITCSTQDELVTLTYDGLVKWARHMTCTFHANLSLIEFPFDTQIFDLQRLSFAYTQDELVYTYTSNLCFNPDPTQNWDNSLWNLVNTDCYNTQYNFRSFQSPYSLVTSNLHVQRKSASYILKMILPMFVVVCLSTLTYWIDPMSPPARVGSTITLVLSIITFNLTVSQDLPKINYSTLLDWYVWKCFLFVLAAVCEFALVNYIITHKYWSNNVALLVDDFCQWTILPVWLLSNLMFWPLMNNVGIGFIATLETLYILANIYRIYWNYRNDQKGMIIPLKRLLYNIKIKYRQYVKHDDDNGIIGLRHENDSNALR